MLFEFLTLDIFIFIFILLLQEEIRLDNKNTRRLYDISRYIILAEEGFLFFLAINVK